MKTIIIISVLSLAVFATTSIFAHHAAEGIVDEEVYDMIDSLVADTPHGEMEEIPSGPDMLVNEITDVTVQTLENMIEDGLLTYVDMLDGDATITISFNDEDNTVTATIEQPLPPIPEP